MELQQTSVAELYLPDSPSPTGGLAYLLPRGTPEPPRALSPADGWDKWPGAYLILPLPVATGSEPAFAAAAWEFLEDPRLEGTRIAWLEAASPPALPNGPAIQVAGSGAGAALAFPATLSFGSVAVTAAAGTEVAFDPERVALELAPRAADGLRLTSRWGSAAVGAVTSKATLPLTGPLAGCLQFAVALSCEDLDAVDAGMRWFYAIPPDPEQPRAPATDFFLGSLRVPLLAAGATLYANLDPLAPLDGDRAFFAFAGADAGEPGAARPGPLPSHLRTTLGRQVELQPLTGTVPSHFAALVFARNQLASSPSPRDPLYLVPRGDFALEPATGQLMCGLSGVEYVDLEGESVLSFFPEADAFAAGFFPGEAAGYTSLQPPSRSQPTTSFAQVTASGKTLTYYAQPDQSILYNHGGLAPQGFTALSAMPVQAGGIASPPATARAFPLLPYAGAEGDLAAFQQLESQIVNPQRRKAIGETSPRPIADEAQAPPSKLSTTPQGLLASYVPGGTQWEEVVLAQMAGEAQLKLAEVKGPLLAAFQSSKLFLVATKPSAMPIPAAASQILIGADPQERWRFELKSDSWRQQPGSQTVLILKFHDMPIAKLAHDPATWASPTAFNDSPETISKQLRAAIEDAEERKDDPDFAAFLAAVNDPAWNGILALNVECPLEELPAQLEGLAAGIDPKAFYAHHVGIALSKIDASKQELAIENSSIFGLLHYEAEHPLPPQAGEYAFQVKQLKVAFLQSAVASFSSLIELEVNSLFGEPATLKNPADPKRHDNVVELYGVYQKHVVGNQVEETYAFQTRSGEVSVFEIESRVLNAVTFDKGQFVTLTDKSTTEKTLSQFVFWGQLDFQALKGFDAFSFGRAQPTDAAAGLAFANLALDMSFETHAEQRVPAFEFDASRLSLDVAAGAPPRDGSLFRHFPLTVAGFTQGKAGTTPDGLGYMGVQTPLTQSPLSFPWFSLNYDLDLGSPGALAAEAGFVASLCVAWTPTRGGAYTVFTGLRLPGSSGAKRQISIEGIFDINFRTLAILAPTPDTYALLLYGIGFQFLRFTFPPSGQINFVLFGNPESGGPGDTTIGWYGAYAKSGSQLSPSTPPGALSAPPPPRLLDPPEASR